MIIWYNIRYDNEEQVLSLNLLLDIEKGDLEFIDTDFTELWICHFVCVYCFLFILDMEMLFKIKFDLLPMKPDVGVVYNLITTNLQLQTHSF